MRLLSQFFFIYNSAFYGKNVNSNIKITLDMLYTYFGNFEIIH
jgi:hypothetical protein